MERNDKNCLSEIPNIRYVTYDNGDMILFDEQSFLKKFGPGYRSREEFLNEILNNSKGSENLTQRMFEIFRKEIGHFNRAGLIGRIQSDSFRSPDVVLFYRYPCFLTRPIDPWVIQMDNGIKYTFDVTRTMFCKGNINEKLRLSKICCQDETVLDLFAGIGYFSLVFAVHCRAKHVYCCEWNPAAIEALRKNIKLNHVEDRCTILEGDNRISTEHFKGKINRVQMGLIPTSRPWLNLACGLLDLSTRRPLTIHFHENLSYYKEMKNPSETKFSKEERSDIIQQVRQRWSEEIAKQVQEELKSSNGRENFSVKITKINRIKPYAPHIDHMVLDLDINSELRTI